MYKNINLFWLLVGVLFLIQGCEDSTTGSFDDTLEFIRSVEPIQGAQNVTINLKDGHSQDAMFEVDFSGIEPNAFINNGKKQAWCIEWDKPVVKGEQQGVKLHSTRRQELWEDVNYFLSHLDQLQAEYPALTWKEKQVVIWSLVKHKEFDIDQIPSYSGFSQNFYKDGEYLFDVALAKEVIQEINLNSAKQKKFIYQSSAIIIENQGQTVIVKSDESVWGFGQYSFRSQSFRDILGITTKGKGQWGWVFEMETDYASTELIAGGGDDDGKKAADEVGTIIGSLEMMKSNDQLKISYSTFPGYLVNDLHLWVGCSLDDFPGVNQAGNVAPGQLPYNYDVSPTNSHTFNLNLSDLNCVGNLFIAAHAGELYMVDPGEIILEPVFTITDINKTGLLRADDINDHGQIVGGNLFWDKDMGLIDMGDIDAIAMNNQGQVAGIGHHSSTPGNSYYFWEIESGLTEITTSKPNYKILLVTDINNHGQVAGEVEFFDPEKTSGDFNFHGMIWEKDKDITNILFAFTFSTATAINDHGELAGKTAGGEFGAGFMFMPCDFEGAFDGMGIGTPIALNNNRQVIGTILESPRGPGPEPSSISFLCDPDDGVKFFDDDWVADINDHGQVVGEKRVDSRIRAFYWDEEHGMIELPTLNGGNSYASAINNNGQIVGSSSGIPVMWEVSFDPKL